MRRLFLSLTTVMGVLLVGACTDSGTSRVAGPSAPPTVRASLQAPSVVEIQTMIAQLLATNAGPRNAASAQFNNVVRSVQQGKLDVAQNQGGALINFVMKQATAATYSTTPADVFLVGSVPTQPQALSQFIAAVSAYLNLAGVQLTKIDAAADFVPKNATADVVVVTGTGLAAVRIPPGALGVDALVTITPIAYQNFPVGGGPLNLPVNGPTKQYPFFYEISAYPVNAGELIASPFNSQVTVEVCQIETGPYAPADVVHPRLRLAHNVGTGVQIVPRVFAPDLICVPPSVGLNDRPMESEGWLAMAGWEMRNLPTRVTDALTPNSALAAHGGLGGLTSSFSPWAAVLPPVIDFETYPTGAPSCASCSVTNEFASLGPTFAYTPVTTQVTGPATLGVDQHDITPTNHSIGSGYTLGTLRMSFASDPVSGYPSSVSFKLRYASVSASHLSMNGQGGDGSVNFQRTSCVIYETVNNFCEETVTATGGTGVASIDITMTAGGSIFFVDDMSINGAATAPATGPTITSVALQSTTLSIGGGNVPYSITLNNPGATTLSGVYVQNYIIQGSANRGANGTIVTCTTPIGDLPPGNCTFTWSAGASNSAAGSGTLVAGPATLQVQLYQTVGSSTITLDTKNYPITLQ